MSGDVRNTQESEESHNLQKNMGLITIETTLGTIRIL